MEINFTLFIQAAIYLALFFILKALYFTPILALLKKRDQLTGGKLDEAGELSKRIEALSAQYEATMKQARESIDANRTGAIHKIRASADEKVQESKSKLEKKLWEYQATLEKDAQALRAKLPALTAELKKEILGAVLNSRVVRM